MPLWDDIDAFYELTTAAKLRWPQVVSWLNDRHRAGLPAGIGFFDVPANHRQMAAEWLAGLAKEAT